MKHYLKENIIISALFLTHNRYATALNDVPLTVVLQQLAPNKIATIPIKNTHD